MADASLHTGDGEDRAGEAGAALETGLELVAAMAEDFATSGDVAKSLGNALERITEHVGAEGGSIFLLEPGARALVCEASTGPVDLRGLRLRVDEGVVGRAVRCNSCEMVRDVVQDPSFDSGVDENTGFTTRSILCASLSVRARSLGAIELVNKRGAGKLFDDHDRRLLRALAAAAGLALHNAQLARDLVEQERVRRELELAAEIQRNLLPAPRPAPFPVCGVNVPARRVSGDFYDYLTLPDGRVAFAVGDVAGKGMNAALLMAKTASLYRCLARSAPGPGRLLSRINQEICDTATRGLFVTMVSGVYDPGSGRVVLANAGHEPPLVHRPGGRFEAIAAESPPLGIGADLFPEEGFPEVSVELDGSCLYVFTDGVTESRAHGPPVGVEGVEALIRELAGRDAASRIEALVDRLSGDPRHDDLTLLVLDPRRGEAG